MVAKASGKLAENFGGEVGNRIMRLWDAVKGKLAGRDALADFEQNPQDEDTQAALRVQLKRALEEDRGFREQIAQLLGELEQQGGREAIIQTASITGDQGKVAQVAGKKNTVRM